MPSVSYRRVFPCPDSIPWGETKRMKWREWCLSGETPFGRMLPTRTNGFLFAQMYVYYAPSLKPPKSFAECCEDLMANCRVACLVWLQLLSFKSRIYFLMKQNYLFCAIQGSCSHFMVTHSSGTDAAGGDNGVKNKCFSLLWKSPTHLSTLTCF